MQETQSYQAYMASPYRSIKHATYFEIYDKLFLEYVGKEIVFVEIGVLSGGSLFMWRNFFGPNARIIGVDLNPNAVKWRGHGFEIYIGSQTDLDFWTQFVAEVGQIDIVLDDGGHTYPQQIITTEMLLPHVRDHGMVVVEDSHTSYMKGFGRSRYSFINYTKLMIDKCNQRFSLLLKEENFDSRVWSVQTFESIVAFHVNRAATCLNSVQTDNQGIDDFAMDFRYQDAEKKLSDFTARLAAFRAIPGIRFLYEKYRHYGALQKIRSFSLKRYF